MGDFANSAADIETGVDSSVTRLAALEAKSDATDAALAAHMARIEEIERLLSSPSPAPAPTPPAPTPPAPPPLPAGQIRPTISSPGNSRSVGVVLTRVPGSVTGHTAYQGRWRVQATGVEIGGQATQSTAGLPIGSSVIYREWYQKSGSADVVLDSVPFGPLQ
jgi:hypothetical protein